ncbi:MAG: hypothetical protein M3Q28_04945 [Pseudomonadota bacterium]|nr:hypothetical protein [Pseudomonadota bacterium]
MKTVAFAVLVVWTHVALAQAGTVPPPPPLPSASETKPTQPSPAKPRRAIELSPTERQAIDARELKAVKPASVEEALQPTPNDARVERDDVSNTTRIEQLRTSNRVSEVIVTPAGTTRSYTMTNREGKQPFGTTQMTPGLSVPNFFRFEFGRAAPAPASAAPAPPTTTPRPAN